MRTAAAWSFPCGGCFLWAGGARLRCCSNPPLRRFTNFRIKQKLQCHYNTGVLGGRGWITQAAHLKRPRRGLFAAGTYGGGPYELRLPIFLQPLGGALKNRSAAPASPPCFRRRRWSAPLLFESTLESETSVFYKTKSPAYFRTLSIFGGAKQPKSEPLPPGAFLAAISSKVMVFVPSL